MVMLPDIWRPLQAANQAKDAARNLGGRRSHPVFALAYIYRPGGIKDPTNQCGLS
jgi:hypothetical protein